MSFLKNKYIIYFILFLFGVFTLLSAALATSLFSFLGFYAEWLARLLSTLFLILVMSKLKLLEKFRFNTNNFFIGILFGLYIVVLMYLNLNGTMNISLGYGVLLKLLVVNLIIGLWEETLCRGVILNVMLRYTTPVKAVLGSSLIFCLLHSINFFTDSTHPILVLSQVIYTFFLGVYFASIVYITKSLWSAIILHGLLDLSNSIGDLVSNSMDSNIASNLGDIIFSGISMILVLIPGFIIGIILMKNRVKLSRLIR